MPKEASVEALLTTHTPEVRALVERLRQLVRQAAPEATEAVRLRWHSASRACVEKRGAFLSRQLCWRGLNYRHPSQGYFCGIFPLTDGANLLFEFGVLLPDAAGLLQGEGKQVRYVPLRKPGDIRVKVLQQLILAALVLPAGRATKLELIRAHATPATRR